MSWGRCLPTEMAVEMPVSSHIPILHFQEKNHPHNPVSESLFKRYQGPMDAGTCGCSSTDGSPPTLPGRGECTLGCASCSKLSQTPSTGAVVRPPSGKWWLHGKCISWLPMSPPKWRALKENPSIEQDRPTFHAVSRPHKHLLKISHFTERSVSEYKIPNKPVPCSP